MNANDIEKTQVWASSLKTVSEASAGTVTGIVADRSQLVGKAEKLLKTRPQLPVRKLTKEEKILLATGGALAVGLSGIVLSSLPGETPAEVRVDAVDLTAPTLDLSEEAAPVPEDLPPRPPAPPPPRAPRPPRAEAPVQEPAAIKPLDTHSMLRLPEEPPVAVGVSDSVTFMEAYNTARAEVGPGGLFAWRGTFYSTFTEAEWESVATDKQEVWLAAANPIIDPEPVPVNQVGDHVFVADKGLITWTGIDKNEDGAMDVLVARIDGQSPMVLMDTDGDGQLDTRFDYFADTQKTMMSPLAPFQMTQDDIRQIEAVEVGADMGFYHPPGSTLTDASESTLVNISMVEDAFFVEIDTDRDRVVDTLTLLKDDSGPFVAIDLDGDGRMETGFLYDMDAQEMVTSEGAPLDPIVWEQDYPAAGDVIPEDDYGMIGPMTEEDFNRLDTDDDPYDPGSGNDPGLADDFFN